MYGVDSEGPNEVSRKTRRGGHKKEHVISSLLESRAVRKVVNVGGEALKKKTETDGRPLHGIVENSSQHLVNRPHGEAKETTLRAQKSSKP